MHSESLVQWREMLDEVDEKIVKLLAERFKITRKIGTYKARNGLETRDRAREAEQLDRVKKIARELHISPELAQNILQSIIEEAAKEHEQAKGSSS